jgi:hypothetical protein
MPAWRQRLSCGLIVALVCCPLMAGCLPATPNAWIAEKKPIPEPPITELVDIWENQIFPVPDPFNGGRVSPCLAGRLYMYGPDHATTQEARGPVSVQLYYQAPPEAGGQLVLLEQWNIKEEQLKNLLHRDMGGLGYTLILPWGTIHPNITKVEMVIAYYPKQGLPLYARSPLKLQQEKRPFTITRGVNFGMPPGRGLGLETGSLPSAIVQSPGQTATTPMTPGGNLVPPPAVATPGVNPFISQPSVAPMRLTPGQVAPMNIAPPRLTQ